MALEDKSIHELREIADKLLIPDIFAKSAKELIRDIQIKQNTLVPTPEPVPVANEVSPEVWGDREAEIMALLSNFIERGLHVSFSGSTWRIFRNEKEDSGHISAQNKAIVKAAEVVMR